VTPAVAMLGVDVGTVRIGIAACGAGVSLAMPVETVSRGDGDLARIATIAQEREVGVIFVGDPITLAGEVGPAAVAARQFATELAAAIPTAEVRMLDERLSTAQSARSLAAAGRDTRQARNVVDQAAAAAILQNAVDAESETGRLAGYPLSKSEK
jgi:putative Holliday junction resolvase